MTRSGLARLSSTALLAIVLSASIAARAREPQLGALVSPGKLTPFHASLEGIRNCQSCHEAGQKVTAQKCLSCHKPVAERMAAKRGVHRNVTECVRCHVEHTGAEGELRPFDTKNFNHAVEASYPLDGKHAALAANCAACHKTRSFLLPSSTCVSCHADVHKGTLGQSCTSCHSTQVAFKDTKAGFDHTKTAYPLVGAHRAVACATCHVNQQYKGLKFQQCTDCHKDTHQQRFGTNCAGCHTNDTWRTRRVEHARTTFPLNGKHATTECAKCHLQPAVRVRVKADTCATCHVDVHRGAFKQDCKSCHTETSFKQAPFDHTTTKFALTGKHATTACDGCHKPGASRTGEAVTASPRSPSPGARTSSPAVGAGSNAVDFRGLKTDCVSCHADPHRAELGLACESCHTTADFKVPTFTHARTPEFFAGGHESVACEKCHLPAGPKEVARGGAVAVLNVHYTAATTTCVSCHRDVHLGQVAQACERCHAIASPKFALVASFSHASTKYPLTGKHETVACQKCHKSEAAAFPAGNGTAVRLTGMDRSCKACHVDVHLGQVAATCESCHTTEAFKMKTYAHKNRALRGFFVGRHASAACQTCHVTRQQQFPGGRGTAVVYNVGPQCVNCHKDIHNGSLGPNCGDCHKP